ncbi:hydantoinase/oxoprolinase family protein [Halioxenophilus aromaticivorans]|uniref:Hydantoinase/oxoprolinase family protein n=1 Tax=Halioxenophilus aromaticivorans TaxID=1306992 RepID=A0AAV3TX74_9ALTE
MPTPSEATTAFSHLLGVDTGGTFTDFVAVDLANGDYRPHKVLSTPDNPALAIVQGIEQLGLADAVAAGLVQIVHGSTVATNAALERKGVRTAYITNRGLADTLTIGRQTRRELYDLQPEPSQPPVPKELCLEIDCRRAANGSIVTELSDAAIAELAQQLAQLAPEAVAINLLFAHLNDAEERRIKATLEQHYFVSSSAFVLPEPGEYERGIATWLNAYLGPKVAGYMRYLQQAIHPSPLAVMQSNGGTMDAQQAGQRAVNMLLSGPAGGLSATQALAQQINQPRLLTFDMGGTSTDVALMDHGIKLTTEGHLGDWPIAVPMVDMHTIGAGGGSLAYVDAGGLLQVGPESAGAKPGPACYGLGGSQPTVTDANAVLGLLRPDNRLGGHMTLDAAAAEQALAPMARALETTVARAARGIVDVVNERMTAALRVISVNKGYNPKDFTLCCFGGAGGLHVCALADKLRMTRAVIPAMGGVFSALGMLCAPKVRQLSTAYPCALNAIATDKLDAIIADLSQQASEQLAAEGVDISQVSFNVSLDLRYCGQSFTLNVDFTDLAQAEQDFHRQHQHRYGHRLELDVELVTLRLRAEAPAAAPQATPAGASGLATAQNSAAQQRADLPGRGPTRIVHREDLQCGDVLTGPALICEALATTLIEANWIGTVDKFGNILLKKS